MKVYPVGIVGESNYQKAIGRTAEGQAAYIRHEPDNPYDELALRVENLRGEVIGYIPKDHWLRNAVHGEGRGCAASILSIHRQASLPTAVVIGVTLTDDALFERGYQTRDKPGDSDAGARAVKAAWNSLVRGIGKKK